MHEHSSCFFPRDVIDFEYFNCHLHMGIRLYWYAFAVWAYSHQLYWIIFVFLPIHYWFMNYSNSRVTHFTAFPLCLFCLTEQCCVCVCVCVCVYSPVQCVCVG